MDQEELINAYLDGRLDPKDQKLLEDMIAQNPEYRSEVEAHRKVKAAITLAERENLKSFLDTLQPAESTNKSAWKSWTLSGVAASTLVLVGYFLWTTLSMSPGEKLYTRHFELYPNLVAPTTRGVQTEDLKAKAFLAYDNGEFELAAARFEELKSQPNSEYALLYLGICHLELGRPEKAIPNLLLISANPNSPSQEVAAWYAALGYFKLNMLDKGKAQLEVTAATANAFQKEAQEILKML
jgi:tetratricopeptide (TPR) repeat protein